MNTIPTPPLGLLWPRIPITQALDVAAGRARRKFVEQYNKQPVAILLNPRHKSDLHILQPVTSGEPSLLGLPVKFDEIVRPHHVFMLSPESEESVLSAGSPEQSRRVEGQQKEASAQNTDLESDTRPEPVEGPQRSDQ